VWRDSNELEPERVDALMAGRKETTARLEEHE
jgi:hypothetical protein